MVKRTVYRVKVKERYLALGIWKDFVELRDRYRELGLSPAQAFKEAMVEVERMFPDGKPKPGRKLAAPTPKESPVMVEIEDRAVIDRLIRQARGRKSSPLTEFTWVYNQAGIPWGDIAPDDVPSAGAVHHLAMVKSNPKNYDRFLSDYAKLLPPRSQLEQTESQGDDGRPTLNLLDALEKELSDEGKLPDVVGQNRSNLLVTSPAGSHVLLRGDDPLPADHPLDGGDEGGDGDSGHD